MISTKGIQIGNWLLLNKTTPVIVESVYKDMLVVGGDFFDIENFEPIALTSQILEKSKRFIKDGTRKFTYFKRSENGGVPDFYSLKIMDNKLFFRNEIIHNPTVHQFQNLVQSITSKELEINL